LNKNGTSSHVPNIVNIALLQFNSYLQRNSTTEHEEGTAAAVVLTAAAMKRVRCNNAKTHIVVSYLKREKLLVIQRSYTNITYFYVRKTQKGEDGHAHVV
jgi:phenylpyruvate tautomerase PptA (4-oxalocrotonate tautomerase family)